ncbi:MAG TPA: hypothetical protein VFY16_04625 [Gemmatimonadaceae bacterium]|nr:hypothetical protein [Gemmatimonadaceae bacterium]
MIVANVRQRLGRDDAQLAMRLIARGSDTELHRAEQALRDEGIDALLDHPRLVSALLEAPQGAHASLALFTYVIVRHALRRAGEHDRTIADYVAAVVLEFGMRDRAQRVAEADDEIYRTAAELLGDVDGPDPRRTLLVRAHLGNYSLWLSGVFPDWIEHRRWRRGGPDLEYFEEIGRRGYRLAAAHRLAEEHGLHQLYAAAADRFEVLRVALNDVSDRLLFPHHHSPERLMRQVRSAAFVRRG